jgi:16S rRNA (adenine(1408)-N(1))-methyltransferase
VLAAAAAQSDQLVIGVDASAAAMATASRRASPTARRGGLPNALFVVAAVEALPSEFDGVARVMRPGATLSMLLSSTARDRGAGAEPIQERTLQALTAAYGRYGLAVTKVRPATPADVAAARSTWGKRLGAGVQRPAWLLRARLDSVRFELSPVPQQVGR